eukprot:TRINITY_DN22747_c0_g1_i1.p1 TRINITY_DN22747_c0_g1~~TRINITY_DN22747_c0_g1_i1.p1  ORF type:complete len:318 (+),score=41.48 TRINITY_DN22747_c0_g1_i1:40-954(+)
MQVISDFGIGIDAQRSKTFIDSFFDVFSHTRVSVYGDRVILLRVYPGNWQIYLCPESAKPRIIGVDFKRPSFVRLEELLQGIPGTRCSMSWIDRIRAGAPSSWAALNYTSTPSEDEPTGDAASTDPNSIDSLLRFGSEEARGSDSAPAATGDMRPSRRLNIQPDHGVADHKPPAVPQDTSQINRNPGMARPVLNGQEGAVAADVGQDSEAQACALRERCLALDAKIEKLQAERAQAAEQLEQLEASDGNGARQARAYAATKPSKGYKSSGFEVDGAKAARDPKQNMMDVFKSIMLLGSKDRQAD